MRRRIHATHAKRRRTYIHRLFTVELAVNLMANWFWPFFTDGWSLFDFIVVLTGLISQMSLLSHIRATLSLLSPYKG
jgi:hypothetical protein